MPVNSRRFLTLGLLLALVVAAAPAGAQTHPIDQRVVAHYESSGLLDNPLGEPAVVFSTLVHAGDAPWLRLTFRRAVLGEGSMLRLTSLLDGARQHLNAAQFDQWQSSSAYFNGGAVMVELIAGPGTRGQIVEIGDIWAGMVPTVPYTQCGPTDDREPSDFPERARLMSIGCTAWMFTDTSCFATAGHCISGNVAQFNVPPSNPNGSLNHPGPEDQYSVDRNSRVWTNGGIGNDWGLFEVFPNSETGMMPYEVQGAFLQLATVTPGVNQEINIVGYGVDGGTRNQTQQISWGPVTTSTQTTLRYQADTQGGNSGSGVVWQATGEAVGIHTHGGCSTSGSGSNAGTAITNSGLQAALATFCQPSTLQISVTGTCPGPVSVSISGAPAGAEVGLLSSGNTNGWVKGGNQCNGTAFEIGEPLGLPPTFVIVDGSGNGVGNMTLSSGMCYVEAISIDNCDTSGATLVP